MAAFGWLDRLLGKREGSKKRFPEGINAGSEAQVGRGQGLTSPENTSGSIISSEEPAITEQELSGLDNRDRQMLRSIIELDYTTVREVMVPRLDMVAIEAGVSLYDAAATIVEHGHSRLPVYVETIDDVLGILYVRDLLAAISKPHEGVSVRTLTRPAFVVPETKRVDDLLEEFRQRRIQIAIVVDEYGGTEGLVTMEDVLEEIVGEIEDEFSKDMQTDINWDEDGAAHVSAGMGTEEVQGMFGVNIESADFDTVGGFVYHHLGRIPHVGDVVEKEGLHLEVVSVAGRRLRSLKIKRDGGGAPADSG